MTDWPDTLPSRFERNGFSHELADNALKTKMDYGPSKRRRRTTTSVEPMTGTMIMTDDQWGDLVEFFKDTVKETLPFNFTMPDGVTEVEVCFNASPVRSYFAPGVWRVAIDLEIQA